MKDLMSPIEKKTLIVSIFYHKRKCETVEKGEKNQSIERSLI